MASIQTLSDSDRRVLARWALACAERVLPLFDADAAAHAEIRDAVDRTRAYGVGESSAHRASGRGNRDIPVSPRMYILGYS